jgi:hypothetical protein
MKRLFLITTATVLCGSGISWSQVPGLPGVGGFGGGAAEAIAAPRPAPPKSAAGSSRSGGSSSVTYFVASPSSSRGDSIPPVVIRFSQPDVKASATLEEDLFVMARVLSRTLERAEAEKVDYKLGVPMLLTGSGRSVRPMYLEGTGPLFMIKVNFPLIPTPKPEAKSAKKTNDDSEWDAAQRDLFDDAEVTYEESSSRNGYKEEQVELLKKELTGALKNAANIRGLRPDEFVNIAVFGQSSGARVKAVTLPGGTGGLAVTAGAYTVDLSNAGKGSVLTLRAKKSDIDDFAAGKLDGAAFKARVTVTAYAGSGVGITSINSWIEEKPSRNSRQ